MKILCISSFYKPAYVYGGPAKSISLMCEALSALGAEVTVLTTNANGNQRLELPLARPVPVDGVQVYYYPVIGIPPRNFFYSPQLAQAGAGQIPHHDLIVLETFYTHAMGPAVAACARAGVPYIVPLRGQLLPWALKQKYWKKRLYWLMLGRRYLNGAAALHCTDPVEAQAAAELGLKTPTFVVPNGVDLSRFSRLPERGYMRRRLGIPTNAKVLLFAGRLHPIKRPDIAVEVLAAAQALPQEVHLVIAGPDEAGLTAALRAQARNLGCDAQLHLVGLLNGDEILHALADADLLLMPSDIQESFGMAAVEALATGVPILVSQGVPVGHWAEKAGAGRVVPSQGPAFARAALDLLSAPDLPEMGARGRLLVQERFDLPMVARHMLAQYQSILATGKPLPR